MLQQLLDFVKFLSLITKCRAVMAHGWSWSWLVLCWGIKTPWNIVALFCILQNFSPEPHKLQQLDKHIDLICNNVVNIHQKPFTFGRQMNKNFKGYKVKIWSQAKVQAANTQCIMLDMCICMASAALLHFCRFCCKIKIISTLILPVPFAPWTELFCTQVVCKIHPITFARTQC